MLPDAAARHYRAGQRRSLLTLTGVRRAWSQLGQRTDEGPWRRVSRRLRALVGVAQRDAVVESTRYLHDVLDELRLPDEPAGELEPDALADVASDGRDLPGLLEQSIRAAREAREAGADAREADQAGLATLEQIVLTQVPDASRVADGIGIAARPDLAGWVRMLNPPSCSRCVVLAGAVYRWNEGFERHPRCDCRHVPAGRAGAARLLLDPREYFDSLPAREQDRVFTVAGARAIRDGADVARVVNARRGAAGLATAGRRLTREEQATLRAGRGRLATTRLYGQDLYVTREGGTVRGAAGQVLARRSGTEQPPGSRAARARARAPRLMPESIYQLADGDRSEAIRLLTAYGYLT